MNRITTTDYDEIFPNMNFSEEEGDKINEAISCGNVVAATDGSVTNNMGSGAFCLSTKDGDILFDYSFPIPGAITDTHSTRTEMMAILGVLIFLRKIHSKYKHPNKPNVLIYTDSKNAIKTAFEKIFVSISNIFEND